MRYEIKCKKATPKNTIRQPARAHKSVPYKNIIGSGSLAMYIYRIDGWNGKFDGNHPSHKITICTDIHTMFAYIML